MSETDPIWPQLSFDEAREYSKIIVSAADSLTLSMDFDDGHKRRLKNELSNKQTAKSRKKHMVKVNILTPFYMRPRGSPLFGSNSHIKPHENLSFDETKAYLRLIQVVLK